MKRRILVRGVLVLILLLALYPLTKFVILPLFDTSGELEGHDVPLYGYSEPDTPMVMENDALRFELDPATTHFTLTDKRTGHVWLSSPDNADSDPIALPVEKNKLNSTLTLTYAASTGMTTQFTSQEHSISNGVYEVLMQEDGSVRVNYSVGRVQRSFLMPTAIGDARMQQFMEKMTSKQKKDIKEYYREYNIDKLRKTDDKAALLAAYPDLAEEHVWVLRDGTKDHLKQRCESIFAEVGYTAEDLAYDNSRIVQAGSTIAKAVFNVSMVFRLDGSDLVVEVPLDDLAYDVDYPLTSLTLLPAFGAGGTEDNGFLFVPDGSGAIIRFNNGRVSQRAYYANLYGWDWASIRTQVTNETRINFPVFGVSGDSGSFICILEDGASWAGIGADIAGRLTSYNTVNATYTIVHGDAYDVSERTNNAVYMFETAHPTGFIRQRYRFLPESGYMDMAASYPPYPVPMRCLLRPKSAGGGRAYQRPDCHDDLCGSERPPARACHPQSGAEHVDSLRRMDERRHESAAAVLRPPDSAAGNAGGAVLLRTECRDCGCAALSGRFDGFRARQWSSGRLHLLPRRCPLHHA